jgi:hypothetical protein
VLAGPCQHEVRHGSALEARSTVSPVRQGKTISQDALSQSKSDSPHRQSPSSPPSRTNSSIQPRSLCDLTTEQPGGANSDPLSPDRSRKTLANVLIVREPGFAESKLRHGSSLGASRFGRTDRAGQGRSMWKARPMKTRSSSPSVGERSASRSHMTTYSATSVIWAAQQPLRTIIEGHNDVRIVERDPAVSRIPPQTSPVDRSRSGDAAFGVRPGVQASTLFADPWTPFGDNGNGCHGP